MRAPSTKNVSVTKYGQFMLKLRSPMKSVRPTQCQEGAEIPALKNEALQSSHQGGGMGSTPHSIHDVRLHCATKPWSAKNPSHDHFRDCTSKINHTQKQLDEDLWIAIR